MAEPPRIFNSADELVKFFTDKELGIQPDEAEAVRNSFLKFKSPNVTKFNALRTHGGDFHPGRIQQLYTDAIVYGHTSVLKKMTVILEEAIPNTLEMIQLETKQINMYKSYPTQADDVQQRREKDISYAQNRINLGTELIEELKYLIPILKKAIEEGTKYEMGLKLIRFPKESRIRRAKDDANTDAQRKQPMNPQYVNLVGTKFDYLAKAYSESYARVREQVGGRKTKKSSQKIRKTRRVKRLNRRK
jgi:hypothetical protein